MKKFSPSRRNELFMVESNDPRGGTLGVCESMKEAKAYLKKTLKNKGRIERVKRSLVMPY